MSHYSMCRSISILHDRGSSIFFSEIFQIYEFIVVGISECLRVKMFLKIHLEVVEYSWKYEILGSNFLLELWVVSSLDVSSENSHC